LLEREAYIQVRLCKPGIELQRLLVAAYCELQSSGSAVANSEEIMHSRIVYA